ncbi:MAG TPA: GspH/FimT family pseudopilin [Candidatus Eisenbacteria bacterium]|nr:GspH/FimT family pseudopilin [Candidatus Eisenbacteria bacterium]
MTGLHAEGFTLVEIVVVITLLAILSWLAYPSLGAIGEIRLDAAARRVASDLRYAQNRAIGSRTVHGVRFDVGGGSYSVYAAGAGPAVVNPADRGKSLAVSFASLAETRGVRIESAAFGATPGVTFDFYGVPRDSAGVELGSPGRVVLVYQGRRDTVEVAPQTGAIEVP